MWEDDQCWSNINMAACRYTCEGCNRAVPRAMWEDDQCWATDSSEFYCYDCWEEWTTKQGGKQGSVCRSSTGSALASTFASTSTFASAFASAPAYNRMDVDEYEYEDEDMFRCVRGGRVAHEAGDLGVLVWCGVKKSVLGRSA